MKHSIAVIGLISLPFVTGCSSLPLPTLPSVSMPWSAAPPPDPNAEAVFKRGIELFSNKKYAAAADQFTRVKQEFPFAPQALDAELKLAESYYQNQQYPEAVAAFQEFQSLHPTNENIPFVIYRLGLAHLDQLTATDRDQKNTQIAKGYFETVINTYPKSAYAAEAKEKLAKCNGYLAEHDFNVAYFYFQQEKYPAARDRFEEIVRRYPGTPVAAKSLFYLGESYRKEKNGLKAALAYEAILQHYPESKLARDAKTQLAELDKEKHDPLAMLLMRDRRPAPAAPPQNGPETAAAAKLKDVPNLVAKTEVVYEEPGDEKGMFRRVIDKINPFSSSDDGKKDESDKKKTESEAILKALAKKKASEKKDESPGVLASLWNGINPFGGQGSKNKQTADRPKNVQLVDQIDGSLKDKGIDSKTQTAALRPPPADLPKVDQEASRPAATDTGELLGKIDSSLKKDGKSVGELPPPPEPAEGFKNASATQTAVAKAAVKAEPPPSTADSGLLGNIDDKLKSRGIEPSKFELPTPSEDAKANAPKKAPVQKIELEPKLKVEKGPLFLGTSELPGQATTPEQDSGKQPGQQESSDKTPETAREIPRALVRGPAQPPPTAAPAPKAPELTKSSPSDEPEEKGALDQLKDSVDSIGKLLNPLSW